MALQNESDQLRAAWRSLSNAEAADGWRIIPIKSKRCRAGVRYPNKEEGLLVGFNVPISRKSDLPQGKGFSVSHVEEAKGEFGLWIGVTRNKSANAEMFVLMAADLLETVNLLKQDEHQTYRLFLSRIKSWQQFMERPQFKRLSEEEEIGLVGELTVLERFIETGVAPEFALDIWKGPANGLRDFVTQDVCIEVKSTVSTKSFSAQINSLEQLDDLGSQSIYLAALRFCTRQEGRTLPQLINSIRGKIGGKLQIPFERNLLLAGYQEAFSDQYQKTFLLIEERHFLIEDGFPRIIRSNVPSEIGFVKYEIDIDLVTVPSLGFSDIIPKL